jgi:hypothetical protein
MSDGMLKTNETNVLSSLITIIHLNDWNPEIHGSAFLKPLFQGLLRKLEHANTVCCEGKTGSNESC